MPDLMLGGSAVVLAALSFYMAYHYARKERYVLSICFVILAGMILRVYASLDFFLHAWDERFHALIAKNLIEDRSCFCV